MKDKVIRTLLTAVVIFNFIPNTVFALDTTEPFDLGFSDFELYSGVGGIGQASGERILNVEGVIGVGLTEALSSSFNYGLNSDERLANSGNNFGLGLFWTPLDLEIFDLDLFAQAGSGGKTAKHVHSLHSLFEIGG